MDMEITLSRTKNPFFEHAEAEYFLAERGGKVVGRISAIDNRLHNETHHDRVGVFGWFDVIDEQEVADVHRAGIDRLVPRRRASHDRDRRYAIQRRRGHP